MEIKFDVRKRALLLVVVMIFRALSSYGTVVDAVNGYAPKFTLETVKSVDGDTIDCVDIYRQPAFDHPSLRNHTIQMRPSSYPTGFKSASPPQPNLLLQRFKNCPEGTVPILRTKPLKKAAETNSIATKKGRRRSALNSTSDDIYTGHEHSIVYLNNGNFHGAEAFLNVWNPVLDATEGEFSLGQFWLLSGHMDAGDLNSVEAGWTVHPSLFGDNKTRLFGYWTNSSYKTGCYNLLCPGFVQTSKRIVLGAALTPVSTYEGHQYGMNLKIFKDAESGNWWLMFQGLEVGYWPNSLFTGLADSATVIEWGGEVFDAKPDGVHTATQMGSGHFATEGFRRASFFSNLKYVDASDVYQTPQTLGSVVEAPNCYNIEIGSGENTTQFGYYFFFGGPGRSPQCP
ncbi:hypothetical protein H6P81_000106 [Aristolochia fimbriata]|uniref:Neprosin PEP catalytic domain-containing protein n=1 Tax=Aristolochia fimbriata TaxID=158543 RepID=A0AAV7F7P8_ARIFI|nr:hypothetical protein H6P81_000106 [Aristolochia fimbriata]